MEFTGHAVRAGDRTDGGREWTFAVDGVLRGDVGDEVVVDVRSGSSCGVRDVPQAGRYYRVHARDPGSDDGRRLVAGDCYGNVFEQTDPRRVAVTAIGGTAVACMVIGGVVLVQARRRRGLAGSGPLPPAAAS